MQGLQNCHLWVSEQRAKPVHHLAHFFIFCNQKRDCTSIVFLLFYTRNCDVATGLVDFDNAETPNIDNVMYDVYRDVKKLSSKTSIVHIATRNDLARRVQFHWHPPYTRYKPLPLDIWNLFARTTIEKLFH